MILSNEEQKALDSMMRLIFRQHLNGEKQMGSGNFAKLGDAAPEDVKSQGTNGGSTPIREERQLLAYLRCLSCKSQVAIQTCGTDKEQRCHDFDDDKEIGAENLHTHILCKCGERVFSGIVSFRTSRDTDSFNSKRKLSWEEKKKQFGK